MIGKQHLSNINNLRCVCGHSRTDHDFNYVPVPHSIRLVTGNTARIVEPCRANDICVCADWTQDQDQPGDDPSIYPPDHFTDAADAYDPREYAEEAGEYRRITGGA